MVMTYKDWAKKLLFSLWGYRTSIHVSTRATPYSLVYGSEAVLPIKVEIQFLRVLVETRVLEKDWAKARYEQLALIDDKRAKARGVHGSGRLGFGLNPEPTRLCWVEGQRTHRQP